MPSYPYPLTEHDDWIPNGAFSMIAMTSTPTVAHPGGTQTTLECRYLDGDIVVIREMSRRDGRQTLYGALTLTPDERRTVLDSLDYYEDMPALTDVTYFPFNQSFEFNGDADGLTFEIQRKYSSDEYLHLNQDRRDALRSFLNVIGTRFSAETRFNKHPYSPTTNWSADTNTAEVTVE